jgi:peptidoglycan hydrolase-like protein with peptidoglycan-binding domain
MPSRRFLSHAAAAIVAGGLGLAVLGLVAPIAAAAPTQSNLAAGTSWHGRAIEAPEPQRRAGARAVRGRVLARGAGYLTPGGSERVRDLQTRLRRLGYRPGPVDGRLGPRTQGALRWFAIKHGLKPSGIADAPLLRHLRARTRHDAPTNPTRGTRPRSAPQTHPQPAPQTHPQPAPRTNPRSAPQPAPQTNPQTSPQRAPQSRPQPVPQASPRPAAGAARPGSHARADRRPGATTPQIAPAVVTAILLAIAALGLLVLATSAAHTRQRLRDAGRPPQREALR